MEMLAQKGDTILVNDGYTAYKAIAKEKTAALSENLAQCTERLARADARVSELEESRFLSETNKLEWKIVLFPSETTGFPQTRA